MANLKSENRRLRMAVIKPCHALGYCPYGPLVEFMPSEGRIPALARDSSYWEDLEPLEDAEACRVFGNDCPVFYCAEALREAGGYPVESRLIGATPVH
jgi:hypothetical protein